MVTMPPEEPAGVDPGEPREMPPDVDPGATLKMPPEVDPGAIPDMPPTINIAPIAIPRQEPLENAYGMAFDQLARRAPLEALQIIEPALAAEPDNTGLRMLRVWAWMIRAQLGPAEDELRSLVEENPSDDWARHALGRVLERQSRLEEALPHLRLAAVMSADPEHETAVLRVERQLAGL